MFASVARAGARFNVDKRTRARTTDAPLHWCVCVYISLRGRRRAPPSLSLSHPQKSRRGGEPPPPFSGGGTIASRTLLHFRSHTIYTKGRKKVPNTAASCVSECVCACLLASLVVSLSRMHATIIFAAAAAPARDTRRRRR